MSVADIAGCPVGIWNRQSGPWNLHLKSRGFGRVGKSQQQLPGLYWALQVPHPVLIMRSATKSRWSNSLIFASIFIIWSKQILFLFLKAPFLNKKKKPIKNLCDYWRQNKATRKPEIRYCLLYMCHASLNVFLSDILQVAPNESIWSLSNAFRDKGSLMAPSKVWVTLRNFQR